MFTGSPARSWRPATGRPPDSGGWEVPATVGAPSRIRTCDARFRKPTLYPLSYEGLAPQASRSRACAAILNGVTRAEDEAGEHAWTALRKGGPPAVRLLLHPYLRWTRADGSLLRGRVAVLAALEADPPDAAPRVTELRDGQVYRWDSSPRPDED